jgi:hypothetical protein
MKAIKITSTSQETPWPNTAAKAKALYDSLKDGESIFFLFSGEFQEQKKIFKKTGDRLICGDVFENQKAKWAEGFGPEDWTE